MNGNLTKSLSFTGDVLLGSLEFLRNFGTTVGKPVLRARGQSASRFPPAASLSPSLAPALILLSLGAPCNHGPTAGQGQPPPSGLQPGVKGQVIQLRSRCHWFQTPVFLYRHPGYPASGLHLDSFLGVRPGHLNWAEATSLGRCLTLMNCSPPSVCTQPDGSALCSLCHTPINRSVAQGRRRCLLTGSHRVLPGLLLLLQGLHTGPLRYRCQSEPSLGLLFPSDTTQFSELDTFNSLGEGRGREELSQDWVEKRIKPAHICGVRFLPSADTRARPLPGC